MVQAPGLPSPMLIWNEPGAVFDVLRRRAMVPGETS
jgi:hypothetical protein